ncbi:MAG: 2OG-Fe(II) oxygenase [Rhodomicrobium sp.]
MSMLNAAAGTKQKGKWEAGQKPFAYLNEDAIRAAVLNNKPYDYAFVPDAIEERFKQEVLVDAPVIPHRGSYGLPSLRRGPKFEAVIQDLLSDRFRHLVEEKFNTDLSKNPPVIVMMGQTSGAYNEGYAHPDSKHKIITVLLGFSWEWPHERGKLRILNSPDRDDFAFEYPPEFGKMLMFRVSDKSWHGFLPQKGQRMSLQLCYCDSESYVRSEYLRHRISAYAKSIPALRKVIGLVPRHNPAAEVLEKKEG